MRSWPPYLLILAFFGVWHGYGLSHRGLLEHDEGHNLLAARTYAGVMRWISNGGPFQSTDTELTQLKVTLHRQGGTLYPAGKPGYIVLLAAASFVTGTTMNAALWLSWIAGMVIIAVTGLVARRLFGPALLPQLVAMTGVGLSPLIGYLSREVGGTVWSIAFGMGGLWVLLSAGNGTAQRIRAVFAGVCFGYGFTCHYNLLPAIAAAFAMDLALTVSEGHISVVTALRLRSKPYVFVLLGLMVVLGAFQIGSLGAEYKLRWIYPKYQNYLAELGRILTTYQLPALRGDAVGEGVRGWGIPAMQYMGKTLLRETLMFIPMIIVPAMWFMRRQNRHPALMPVLVFFALNLAFWLLHPWKVERSWGMLSISTWLLGAALMLVLHQQWTVWPAGRRMVTLAGLLGVIIASLAFASDLWLKLWHARSPMHDVVETTLKHIHGHGGSINATSAARSFAPLWKWYVVELGRRKYLSGALKHVNFSDFSKPEIVFLDPNTWNDPGFPATREAIADARLIGKVSSSNPSWELAAYDLRTTATLTVTPPVH